MLELQNSKFILFKAQFKFLDFVCTMDVQREPKRSLKVREQQEAEIERIEASKKRYAW